MDTMEQALAVAEEKSVEVMDLIQANPRTEITTQPIYDKFVEVAKAAKAKARELETERKELVQPLNSVVKKINDKFKQVVAPLVEYESAVKLECGKYVAEQRRIAEQKRREAEEKARIERERMEAEARKQREAEEQARREEYKARRAAQEAQEQAERERLEKEAERKRRAAAEAQAVAQAHEDHAQQVRPEPTQRAPQTSGVYTVDKFKVEIVDKKAFLEWIILAQLYDYITIDVGRLNAEAQRSKGEMQRPGVKVIKYQETRMR